MDDALTGTDRRDRLRCFRYLARMGDPYPIAEWLGIDYIPPSLPKGSDLSEEWEQHRIHAARWIRDTYERIYEQVLLLPEECGRHFEQGVGMGMCAYRQHATGTRCATWHNWHNWHSGYAQHGTATTPAGTGVSNEIG